MSQLLTCAVVALFCISAAHAQTCLWSDSATCVGNFVMPTRLDELTACADGAEVAVSSNDPSLGDLEYQCGATAPDTCTTAQTTLPFELTAGTMTDVAYSSCVSTTLAPEYPSYVHFINFCVGSDNTTIQTLYDLASNATTMQQFYVYQQAWYLALDTDCQTAWNLSGRWTISELASWAADEYKCSLQADSAACTAYMSDCSSSGGAYTAITDATSGSLPLQVNVSPGSPSSSPDLSALKASNGKWSAAQAAMRVWRQAKPSARKLQGELGRQTESQVEHRGAFKTARYQ